MSRFQARAKLVGNCYELRAAQPTFTCGDGLRDGSSSLRQFRRGTGTVASKKIDKNMRRARLARKMARLAPTSGSFARAWKLLSQKFPRGRGFWGVLVTDRDTGETLYDLNSGHLFAPASNAKLFTTAFALATLGPNINITRRSNRRARWVGRAADRRFDFGGARRSRSFE